MFEIVVVLTVVFGGLLVVGALVARRRIGMRSAAARDVALGRAQRGLLLRAAVAVGIALVVFVTLAVVTDQRPLLQGVLFTVAPALSMGLGLLAFALMPNAIVEGAVEVRTADLQRRTPLSVLQPRRARVVGVASLAAVLVIVMCGVLSKAPAGDGRLICTSIFTATCTAGGPYLFPGWYFALPTLGALSILWTGGYLALWRIARAPVAAWSELRPVDSTLRRNAGSMVSLAMLAAVLMTGAEFLAGAGIPLLNAPVLATGLSASTASALSILGVVSTLLGALALVTGLVIAFIAVLAAVRVARVRTTVAA